MAKKKVPSKVDRKLATTIPGGRISEFAVADLKLDIHNPRFGGRNAGKKETDIFDYIFEHFDLTDVLSSIAVNGFFRSEPLIGSVLPGGTIRIVEGNRRLAACLILTGDPRASSVKSKTTRFRELWNRYGNPRIEPIPVAVYQESAESEFQAYLGVRHIQGSRTWDSYAKAAWIASMVQNEKRSIDSIAEMIGDTSRLAKKLLAAYYLSGQLESEKRFDPDLSERRGKGSCVNYPFSWVYTILGSPSLREWLGMPNEPSPNPLPNKRSLDRAETLYWAMFGQRSIREPAIAESRQLGVLANAIITTDGERLLRRGKKIDELLEETKDPKTKIEDGLTKAEEGLHDCLSPISSKAIDAIDAESLEGLASKVVKLSRSVHQSIREFANHE